jgi:hypothetical protein
MEKCTECLNERGVRQGSFEERTLAVEDADLTLPHTHRQLGKKPALANAGLPCEEDSSPSTLTSFFQALL